MTKKNLVNTQDRNEAVISLINDKSQLITVDANFFIPPDRAKEASNIKAFNFEKFKEIWITPLINTFPNIAIHEAVHSEILGAPLTFVDSLLKEPNRRLILLLDSELSAKEKILRNTIEEKIAPNTAYNPQLNNKDDRGEVKSLSYIATKGLLYFCSHDNDAIRLIDEADKLDTGLQDIYAIRTYEILYLILKSTKTDPQGIRALYKYLYHFTPRDKARNLPWGEFTANMDKLYNEDMQMVISKTPVTPP
jgi:hypothetical protein